MKDVRLLLELSAKMLILAKDRFDNHGCNDLDKEICELIPKEWCEEARYMNSNGTDPWPGFINKYILTEEEYLKFK